MQEELLKLKQEKSGMSETGQSNTKAMRDRVGKRDVWERVGGSEQVLRRKDMSVKERVGEARKQQQGSLLFPKFEFLIKAHIEVLSFL